MFSDESNKQETCTYVEKKNNSKKTNLVVDLFILIYSLFLSFDHH